MDWAVEVDFVMADTCPVACPCLLGLQPAGGRATFIGGGLVRYGLFGDVDLEGVTWAVVGRYTGYARHPELEWVHYYINSEASHEQREAVKAIVSSRAFSQFDRHAVMQEAPVTITMPEDELGVHVVGVRGHGQVSIEPLEGSIKNEPMLLYNPAYVIPFDELIVGRSEGAFLDGELHIELSEHSGKIGALYISSGE